MSKTHYNPYASTNSEEDGGEQAMCGTYFSEDGNETNDKESVTCKKCLNKLEKIDKWKDETEEHILNDMESFVSFCNENIKTQENESI